MQTGKQYILAIDQGTSSTKTLVFGEQGKAIAKGTVPLVTQYLDDGHVEQDPEAIWQNVQDSVRQCLDDFKKSAGEAKLIQCIGISNQRETFVIWDESGKPLYNAVVWQCKRSVDICERLKQQDLAEDINKRTGLLIDPYFSGTKLIWLYENVEKVKTAIDSGRAFFGTIDSWLLYKLTNGKNYFTDYTNASRTLFFNLATLDWDKKLLADFGLSKLNLPQCKPSSFSFGETSLLGHPVPVTGMIGDSHAAAFGEGCFEPGSAKATLGTGCSVLMNIGDKPRSSSTGMVTTICWSTEERISYALEGVIVSCGSTIEWLKNEMGLFTDNKEIEAMATSVPDNGGVYIIPAFSGLGAPHWDMKRKAAIYGLTFASTKNHLVRAALESIAYQINDVLEAMEKDADTPLKQLMVDGGITANKFMIQFLSDLINKQVISIGMPDVSAMGAAYMAGLKKGIYKNLEHLQGLNADKVITAPSQKNKTAKYYEGWQRLIANRD
jgi:glycerol kinase